jgi:acyl carrier protein phosphodiesterase
MNYLAHAYLSFNQPEILVGNMISDFVKGKKKFDFAPGIQKELHYIGQLMNLQIFTPLPGKPKLILKMITACIQVHL